MQMLATRQGKAASVVGAQGCSRVPRITQSVVPFRAAVQQNKPQKLVALQASSALAFGDFADDSSVQVKDDVALKSATDRIKLRIRMRGYDHNLLQDACNQIATIAEATGAAFAGPVMLPTKRRIYCVLRSPHVNKDSREHFEMRTHNRLVDLKNLSVQTVGAMMEWVPPAGVEVQCSIA